MTFCKRNSLTLFSGNIEKWTHNFRLTTWHVSNGKWIDENDKGGGYSDAFALLNIDKENESAYLFYHPSTVIDSITKKEMSCDGFV